MVDIMADSRLEHTVLNRKVLDILSDGMDEIITDDTLELIRKTTAKIAGATDRATEWASKML